MDSALPTPTSTATPTPTPTPTATATATPTATPTFAGLTTSAELTRRQLAVNRAKAAAAHRSSLEGLTLRVAMQDIRDAVLGIPKDIARAAGGANEVVSLSDVFMKRDRLRGVGLVLVVCSVLFLVAS